MFKSFGRSPCGPYQVISCLSLPVTVFCEVARLTRILIYIPMTLTKSWPQVKSGEILFQFNDSLSWPAAGLVSASMRTEIILCMPVTALYYTIILFGMQPDWKTCMHLFQQFSPVQFWFSLCNKRVSLPFLGESTYSTGCPKDRKWL